ncbi:putative cytochrome P450 oxidoreductase [Macrophomina phaseolina]|uniref:Cytochrome P450 oxidoreductase n=1 Tax=Macrophomina phaseolina TaxID=35725 RepID=A0ABQ8GI97_9PEZI|nr:putative cytochrome P450 oxidoreductase [Macrophomina phaseolina]
MLPITVLSALLAAVLYLVYGAFNRNICQHIIGPRTLPFIGNLHQIPKNYTHVKFTEWARQYGGLYTLKLGNATMAVITDRSLVKSTVDKKSNIYSHRPSSYVSHDLITKGNHLLVMFYGEKWRTFRRLIHQHLTENMVEREHLSIVNAEAVQLVRDYMLFPEDHMLHPKRFSNSISNSIVYGIRTPHVRSEYMRRLYTLMESWSELMETGNTPPVDIFPWLKAVPQHLFGNYKKRSVAVSKQMENLYEDILQDVEKRRAAHNAGSFMDVVLDQQDKIQLPRDQLRFIGGVLMEGGSDTSSSLILAIIQALILNPEVQEKAHREIAAVVGEDRSPQWSDMDKLPYVNMIVKEGHRWRPILPLCFPHALGQDDWVDGKFLPKGTIVILNVWGMHMDPQVWLEPEKFNPDRYHEHPKLAPDYVAGGDWQKRDHYGYGAGRRICPGMYLAERNMLLSIAKLIWAFKFEPKTGPDGRPLPIDPDPVTGYHNGFLYCAKDYGCDPVLRSDKIRATVLREYDRAERDVFNRFGGA